MISSDAVIKYFPNDSMNKILLLCLFVKFLTTFFDFMSKSVTDPLIEPIDMMFGFCWMIERWVSSFYALKIIIEVRVFIDRIFKKGPQIYTIWISAPFELVLKWLPKISNPWMGFSSWR